MKTVPHSQMMTALTLANAAEIIAAVIRRIAGNDISTAVNGETLTKEAIHSIALNRLRTLIKAQ